MTRNRHNTQMFALSGAPPEKLELRGGSYKLVRVFKHDFFAATCLYQITDTNPPKTPAHELVPKIVVKFARTRRFLSLPCRWLGKLLCDREEGIYRTLSGIRGVPRWIGRIDDTTCAVEYVEARPLDHLPAPPPGFFDRLRKLFDAIHARGVGYCDANKRSNILVGPHGEPFLVDYQISVRRRDDWVWPFRTILQAVVRYIAEKDIYHLYKHKRRLSPQELTPEEELLSRRRRGPHLLHRRLTKHWRAVRRRFLQKQYQQDRLISPTADLEDHHQPEKATWRKKQGEGR